MRVRRKLSKAFLYEALKVALEVRGYEVKSELGTTAQYYRVEAWSQQKLTYGFTIATEGSGVALNVHLNSEHDDADAIQVAEVIELKLIELKSEQELEVLLNYCNL